ncbi:MAG: HAD family hydrolase [SAR324 cluster bacterium]|nr:HAD family hydrolase [SAR324 cluster bacterium]
MKNIIVVFSLFFLAFSGILQAEVNLGPLSTWNNSRAKVEIIRFVKRVTTSGPDFVPVSERIATFDFDGTIGLEKPTFIEVMVSAQRMCEIATPQIELQPYIAACHKDWGKINANASYTNEIIMVPFFGQSLSSYESYATRFLSKPQKNSRFKMPYKKLVYKPMVELISYLVANDFTVYIVSGSQTAFLRAMVKASGLQVENSHIIGSTVAFDFVKNNGRIQFIRKGSHTSVQADGPGKAELIKNIIGRNPIFTAGNTMGDYQMLLYSSRNKIGKSKSRPGFSMIINHDDPSREYQYFDPTLLLNAKKERWLTVSMKYDFRSVF